MVTDYTTDVNFKIPAIGDILDPKKYEVVDRDIRYGLNNVLYGEEKYANTSTKIEVFLSRLKHARETFLNEFLIPEMKKVSRDLGFKNMPTPRFKDADFKNDINISRIYSRLIELGVLTPEEGLAAIETGRLPLPEESIKSQEKFIKLQEDGLYQPLLNKGQAGTEPGRPAGSEGVKKSVNTPKNIANSSRKIDGNLMKKHLIAFDDLKTKVGQALKKKFNRKNLSKEQHQVADLVTETIAANEKPENWQKKVDGYITKPTELSNNHEIIALAQDFGVSYTDAILIYHSLK